MIHKPIIYISVIFFVSSSLFLAWFPEYDLSSSMVFYRDSEGFLYKNTWLIYGLYQSIPIATKFFAFICAAGLLVSIFLHNFRAILRSGLFFLLVSCLIGPGLVVNYGMKEHFGRARPRQIIEFGGQKKFSAAFKMRQECKTNCSFTSGHAAMAFYFTALAYVVPACYFNTVYLAGLLFGIAVGLSRIAMGGHFLSDVTSSAFIVLLVNHLLFLLILKKSK